MPLSSRARNKSLVWRPVAGGSAATTLRWLGQSCFLLTSATGTRILMDPIPKGYGYEGPPFEEIDAVTVTHEHPDHSNVTLAAGNPVVLRGLSGGDWTKIDQKLKDVTIRTVDAYHDGTQGAQRGKNAVFVVAVDGMRIVHLGDLGHVLSAEQESAIKPVDILIIPVGGFYTIDPSEASRVIEQLEPRVAIPIHYKTARMRPDWPGGGVEDFLKGKKVQKAGTSTYEFTRETLPGEPTVMLLDIA